MEGHINFNDMVLHCGHCIPLRMPQRFTICGESIAESATVRKMNNSALQTISAIDHNYGIRN